MARLRSTIRSEKIEFEDSAWVVVRALTIRASTALAVSTDFQERLSLVLKDCIIRCGGFQNERGDELAPHEVNWNELLSADEGNQIISKVMEISKISDDEAGKSSG